MWTETSISCLSYVPQSDPKPTPQAGALMGNGTDDFLLCVVVPSQLNHTGQVYLFIFWVAIFIPASIVGK